jgi:hypothetical protein
VTGAVNDGRLKQSAFQPAAAIYLAATGPLSPILTNAYMVSENYTRISEIFQRVSRM